MSLQKGIPEIILPDSLSEADSINTADAFLINKCDEWYFVEFKDAKMSNAKTGVLKRLILMFMR